MITSLAIALIAGSQSTALEPSLNTHLEPFRPYLNRTFKGALGDGASEATDVSRYERAMNGQAIRNLHSVNDGEYGGETLIYWDAKKELIAFIYVTTAGFQTVGTISFEGPVMVSLEDVIGEAGGVTKVRGKSELKSDGTMTVTAEYLRNGDWEPGRTSIYKEDLTAKIVFK
ncbi:MAG: hypothetical protein KF812_01005 [Fimbriimonadaceae bacterium]|nr:hypothetical protein [Fimbriimonadaceae bacterium]